MGNVGMSWGDFMKKQGLGGRNRLRDWKEDGSIIVFVHTNSQITPRLFHLVPYVGEREEDGKKKRSILYLPFVCHEEMDSYFKRLPPQHCPICRIIHAVGSDGRIDDNETAWDASIGNRKLDRIATKADFCGLEGGDWRGAFKPRAQYIFVVIDAKNPDEGLRIAEESVSIGDALKNAVKIQMDTEGEDAGNPAVTPYAFKFVHNKDAKKPADFYHVYAYRKEPVTEQIQELLAQPAVDITSRLVPGDSKKLREIFEAHFKLDIDLDEYWDNTMDEESSTSEQPSRSSTHTARPERQAKPSREPDPEPEPETDDVVGDGAEEDAAPEEDDDMIQCESCDGTGKVTIGKKSATCPFCGGTGLVMREIEEEEATADPPPPPEKKPPVKQTQAKPPTRATKAAPQPDPKNMTQCGVCSKMIPEDANPCPFCGTELE